jgi:hypothetical protein
VIKEVDARQLRRSLELKGFQENTQGRRDHEMYFFFLDGKKTSIWVKLSHGAKAIAVGEIKMNARSVGLTGDDLYRILCCDHDAETTAALCRAALENHQ